MEDSGDKHIGLPKRALIVERVVKASLRVLLNYACRSADDVTRDCMRLVILTIAHHTNVREVSNPSRAGLPILLRPSPLSRVLSES